MTKRVEKNNTGAKGVYASWSAIRQNILRALPVPGTVIQYPVLSVLELG